MITLLLNKKVNANPTYFFFIKIVEVDTIGWIAAGLVSTPTMDYNVAKRVLVKKTLVILGEDVKVVSISMSFTVDSDLWINVFVVHMHLGVLTKCQSSWKTNGLNSLPDL